MNFIRGFLDNDSVFGQIMWRCGIIIGANLLFILCSIPLVTVGAAYTALYYTTLKTLRGDGQIRLFRTFWTGLMENFRQATLLWLAIAALGGFIGLEIFWCGQFTGIVHYFKYGLMAILFIVAVIGLYGFPILAAFRVNFSQLLKNAVFFAIGNPINLVLILFVHAAPIYLTYANLQYLPLFSFLWCLAGFGAVVMFSASLLVKQFIPYLPMVDAAGDILTEEDLRDSNLVTAQDTQSEEKTLWEMRKYNL